MPINKNNKDLLLIFDVTIGEIVFDWAKKNPQAIEEAISGLGLFSQTKKFSRGSEAYFDLISRNIIVSRDVERAAKIALETLQDYRKKKTQEESSDE